MVSQIVAWDHSLGAISSRRPGLLVGLTYACFGVSSVFLDFLRNGLRILSFTCIENWSPKLYAFRGISVTVTPLSVLYRRIKPIIGTFLLDFLLLRGYIEPFSRMHS